jgi:hypothetical protein
MTQTQNSPVAENDDEANYAQHVIWRLVGSTIVAFGANEAGEILLSTDKGDEFIIGKDEHGEITLFEAAKGV